MKEGIGINTSSVQREKLDVSDVGPQHSGADIVRITKK